MQARTPIRPLLVCAALLVASSAMAQSGDKDRSTTSKQGATKSSAAKPAAAPKRLEAVPGSNVKEASTRPAAAGRNAQTGGKDDSHCDHGQASDA